MPSGLVLLGDRLMVGRLVLVQKIGVRVPIPQVCAGEQEFFKKYSPEQKQTMGVSFEAVNLPAGRQV